MQISALNAQTRYMVKKLLTAAAVVCILAGAAGRCVKFISDTGGYYLPEDLAGFSSLTCETDGKTVKVQKKTVITSLTRATKRIFWQKTAERNLQAARRKNWINGRLPPPFTA